MQNGHISFFFINGTVLVLLVQRFKINVYSVVAQSDWYSWVSDSSF